MGSVAVVALRRQLAAQLRHLAVVRLEVRRDEILMATSTLHADLEAEVAVLDSLDLVRGVAVVADGQLRVGLGDRRAVHTVGKGFLDSVVAAPAGRDDIVAVDGRPWIVGRKRSVRGMARGARGGDQ